MGSISFRSSYFWHSLVSNDLHSLLRLFSLAAAASPRSHDRTITHYDAQMRGSQAVRAGHTYAPNRIARHAIRCERVWR
jgi:hypothetical protein